MCCHFTTPVQSRTEEGPGMDTFIALPLTAFEITPKTDSSAQGGYLHCPELFQHVFSGGEHAHVHQFSGQWVIYHKVQN